MEAAHSSSTAVGGSDSGPPVVLSIAGSDNSCGAGVQADLKTIHACGCYGLTAVTCVVAEVPGEVAAIHPVPAAIVTEQVRLSFEAFPVRAVKTGMLFSCEIIEAVAGVLDGCVGKDRFPLVIDPVMVASSGDALLEPTALGAYCELLLGKAALVTPNLHELELLAGFRVTSLEAMEVAGQKLVERYGTAFLVKGGHLAFGQKEAIDCLVTPEGSQFFRAPYIAGVDPHGTGCTYSAAIAANLAKGMELEEAIRQSKEYITDAIRSRLRWRSTEVLRHC